MKRPVKLLHCLHRIRTLFWPGLRWFAAAVPAHAAIACGRRARNAAAAGR